MPTNSESLLRGARAGVISVVVFLGALEVAGRAGLFDMWLVPVPTQVARAMVSLLLGGPLLSDITATGQRIAQGYLLGASLGLLMGLTTGLNARLRALIEPLIQLGRPIPAVALVPLALAWFGIGELAKVSIVGWACFFPAWIATHSGVRRVPAELTWTAAVLGADRKRTIVQVVLPWAAPFIFVGLRTAMGLAFAATVVAEMSGASAGLGLRIWTSHQVFRVADMLAAIVVVGALGAIADLMFRRLCRWLTPWLEQDQSPELR